MHNFLSSLPGLSFAVQIVAALHISIIGDEHGTNRRIEGVGPVLRYYGQVVSLTGHQQCIVCGEPEEHIPVDHCCVLENPEIHMGENGASPMV